MNRRLFLSTLAAATSASAKPTGEDQISLAAWSLNRSFFAAKKWTNLDLPRIVREDFGLGAVELVNQFFENPRLGYLQQLKRNGEANGVRFVLIMVDGEGDMSAVDTSERKQAAVAHRKWVDIAHYLGCHAIRVNMGGPRENWQQDKDIVKRAAESFSDLLAYSEASGLNIVIENHGGASSNKKVLPQLMKAVNHPRFGTLPDFGNINAGDDNMEVLKALLPWAKGISVKASWSSDGSHSAFDLEGLLRACVSAGVHGYWGIESSFGRRGPNPLENLTNDQIWDTERKGVRLTKSMIESTVFARSSRAVSKGQIHV